MLGIRQAQNFDTICHKIPQNISNFPTPDQSVFNILKTIELCQSCLTHWPVIEWLMSHVDFASLLVRQNKPDYNSSAIDPTLVGTVSESCRFNSMITLEAAVCGAVELCCIIPTGNLRVYNSLQVDGGTWSLLASEDTWREEMQTRFNAFPPVSCYIVSHSCTIVSKLSRVDALNV